MRGLIYTANMGGYDTPKALHVEEEGIDYRLFTDDDRAWPGWTLEQIPEGVRGRPLFMARQIKVMAPHLFPHYDWFLWLDGTMQIKAPLRPLIDRLLKSKHDFGAFKHNEWQCAYREIEACIERKKDNAASLLLARGRLEGESMPKNLGQLATGVLFRKNTELVKSHALSWWCDMQQTTMRDQATFMLNLWNLGAYIEWIPGLHTDNEWIEYRRGHVG